MTQSCRRQPPSGFLGQVRQHLMRDEHLENSSAFADAFYEFIWVKRNIAESESSRSLLQKILEDYTTYPDAGVKIVSDNRF